MNYKNYSDCIINDGSFIEFDLNYDSLFYTKK